MEELTCSKHIIHSLDNGDDCSSIIKFMPFCKYTDVWSTWEDCLIFSALRANDKQSLSDLIDGGNIIMINSRNQNTFHYAVQVSNISTISFMLNKIAAVHLNVSEFFNRKDNFNRTPLDLALYFKHYDIARVLCEFFRCTASITIRRSMVLYYSREWLEIIVKYRLLMPIELSFTFHKSLNVLHRAIIDESVHLIKLLLSYGMHLCVKTLDNTSITTLAAATRNIEIISAVKYGTLYDVISPLYPISRIQEISFEK